MSKSKLELININNLYYREWRKINKIAKKTNVIVGTCIECDKQWKRKKYSITADFNNTEKSDLDVIKNIITLSNSRIKIEK